MNFLPVLRYPAVVPYRIDIASPPDDALEQLVQLGALDIEPTNEGLAAIIPDGVSLDSVVGALGAASVAVSPAVGRDDGSVWLLNMRAVRIGSFLIAPVIPSRYSVRIEKEGFNTERSAGIGLPRLPASERRALQLKLTHTFAS